MKNLRIKKLKSYAQGKSGIDIGTDHGYLLLELFKDGFTNLLAVEKNKGPYDNCQKTINENAMQEVTELLLSDGLKKLDTKKAQNYENIFICGMGGDLIKTIIEQDIEKFYNSLLILQPNNNEYKLRKFLNKNKFEILSEDIINDNNKIYEIIVCKYNKFNNQSFDERELMLGLPSKYEKEEFKKKWDSEYEHLKNVKKILEINNKEIDQDLEKRLLIIESIKESK